MTDDGITNLSEIDWDHISMHPCHGMEGYEPRPEYSEIVQERKRYKAVIGLQFFRAAIKLFAVLGACLLMKVIIDYAKDIRAGTIDPPAYNELAFLVYLISGLVSLIGVLTLIRRFRLNTGTAILSILRPPKESSIILGAVTHHVSAQYQPFIALSSRHMARTPYPSYVVSSDAVRTHPPIGLVECAECDMAQNPGSIGVLEPYFVYGYAPLSCDAHSSSI